MERNQLVLGLSLAVLLAAPARLGLAEERGGELAVQPARVLVELISEETPLHADFGLDDTSAQAASVALWLAAAAFTWLTIKNSAPLPGLPVVAVSMATAAFLVSEWVWKLSQLWVPLGVKVPLGALVGSTLIGFAWPAGRLANLEFQRGPALLKLAAAALAVPALVQFARGTAYGLEAYLSVFTFPKGYSSLPEFVFQFEGVLPEQGVPQVLASSTFWGREFVLYAGAFLGLFARAHLTGRAYCRECGRRVHYFQMFSLPRGSEVEADIREALQMGILQSVDSYLIEGQNLERETPPSRRDVDVSCNWCPQCRTGYLFIEGAAPGRRPRIPLNTPDIAAWARRLEGHRKPV